MSELGRSDTWEGHRCQALNRDKGLAGFQIPARTGIPVFPLVESPIIALLTPSGSARQLTGSAIRAALGFASKSARVLRVGGAEDLGLERIAPGELIRVSPGQRFVALAGDGIDDAPPRSSRCGNRDGNRYGCRDPERRVSRSRAISWGIHLQHIGCFTCFE